MLCIEKLVWLFNRRKTMHWMWWNSPTKTSFVVWRTLFDLASRASWKTCWRSLTLLLSPSCYSRPSSKEAAPWSSWETPSSPTMTISSSTSLPSYPTLTTLPKSPRRSLLSTSLSLLGKWHVAISRLVLLLWGYSGHPMQTQLWRATIAYSTAGFIVFSLHCCNGC